MKRISIALFLMTLTACGPAPFEDEPTQVLTVGTTFLDFGQAVVGEERVREVSLNAFGNEDVRVFDFEIQGAFSHDAGEEITIPAGQTRRFNVRFTAAEVGPFSGTLSALSDADNRPNIEIRLVGEGVERTTCDQDSECVDHVFDEVLGRCVFVEHTRECDDGLRCTIGDHCQAGVCAGSPRRCDDEIECTEDRCTEVEGCVFEARDALCEDSDCASGECSPSSGCVDVPLPDSTVCGDERACSSDRCVSGLCTVVFASEGTPCDDGDRCSLGDHCALGSCVSDERYAESSIQSVQRATSYLKAPQRSGDTLFGSEGYGLEPSGAGYRRVRFDLPLVERWTPLGENTFAGRTINESRDIIADLSDLRAPVIRPAPFEVHGGNADHIWGCNESGVVWATRNGLAISDLRFLGACPRDLVAGDDIFVTAGQVVALSDQGMSPVGNVPMGNVTIAGRLAYVDEGETGWLIDLNAPVSRRIALFVNSLQALSTTRALSGLHIFRLTPEGFEVERPSTAPPLPASSGLKEDSYFDDEILVYTETLKGTQVFSRIGDRFLNVHPWQRAWFSTNPLDKSVPGFLKNEEQYLMTSSFGAIHLQPAAAPIYPNHSVAFVPGVTSWTLGEQSRHHASLPFDTPIQQVTIEDGVASVLEIPVQDDLRFESMAGQGCEAVAHELHEFFPHVLRLDFCTADESGAVSWVQRAGPFDFDRFELHENALTLITQREGETDFQILHRETFETLDNFTLLDATSPAVLMEGEHWLMKGNDSSQLIKRTYSDAGVFQNITMMPPGAEILALKDSVLFIRSADSTLELWDVRTLEFVKELLVEDPLDVHFHEEGVAVLTPAGIHELSTPCLLR